MSKKNPNVVSGFSSMIYSLKQMRKSTRPRDFLRVLRSKNTCKACALGMRGMKNELGEGFQVCKKSMQAIAQDLQQAIPAEFFTKHSLEDFTYLKGRELEALGRIGNPLHVGDGDTHFTPISWNEAYSILLKKFHETAPNRSFFYTSGRSSSEAAFMIQLFARQYGTNNVNNCSYYCHQASGVGLKQSIGTRTATINLEDVDKADLIVVIGANPSSNHPRFITHLANVRKRGGKVLIVNPYLETGLVKFKIPSQVKSTLFGSTISDYYIQPHCGGDMALLKATAVYLFTEIKVPLDFIEKYCNNVEEYKSDLQNANIDQLLEMAGVSREDMETFAEYLVNGKNIIFAWAMGLTHQVHGTDTIRTLANLSLLLGAIGKPHSGLLPLRGHSNVQAMGSMGVVPKLPPSMIDKLANTLKIDIPVEPGLDTFSCMESAYKGKFDLAILLGGNLLGSNPNTRWAQEAMNKISFTCHISTTINTSHIFGRGKEALILPVRVRDEENQHTSQESMFNYVRMSVGGSKPPVDDLPSEVDIISHWGKEMFNNNPLNWNNLNNHQKIRELIAGTVPNYHPIAELTDKDGEFTVPGRIKHEPKFDTENHKANLFISDPPDTRPPKGKFNLLSFRSEGQFNTIVYDDYDLFRGVNHRNLVFMNNNDIIDFDFHEGETVIVKSKVGVIRVEIVSRPIRQGNVAMYFPEANVLIPGDVDPKSRTPGFKRTIVNIRKN